MSSDLFITEVDASRKIIDTSHLFSNDQDLLHNVRKEHTKVREVVDAFRIKVDKLIDKQRLEYIQAYENHVQDVQKELHNLREKVYEIANDDTKNERTEKLKLELKYYKNEALQLETDSDEIRSTLARLMKQLYSVEKSRDWMLKKLRAEKKKYDNLLKEKLRLYEEISVVSAENLSTYTLEFNGNPESTLDKDNAKFKRSVRYHASVNRNVQLPKIDSKARATSSKPSTTQTTQMMNLSPLDLDIKPQLSNLVAIRSTVQEIRDFVKLCKSSLHKRPWCKVEKRNFVELLSSCKILLDSGEELNGKVLLPIVCELAANEPVYTVLEELFKAYAESPTNNSPSPPHSAQEYGNSSAKFDILQFSQDILNWKPDP